MDNNLDNQSEALIEQLIKVKEQFIKYKQDAIFSIRKDIVAAELKDILESNASYYELKESIESYITQLLNI